MCRRTPSGDGAGHTHPFTARDRRLGFLLGTLLRTSVDLILQRDQAAGNEKGARRSNRHQKGLVDGKDLQAPAFSARAKKKLHVGEQCAGAQQLSNDA